MSEKTREICTIVSQESIGAGIYSMWIQTDKIAVDAKPGQFVSLYTNDKSKILPRPISLCEIDKENKRLHLVYRVTGNRHRRIFKTESRRYDSGSRTAWKWFSGRESTGKECIPYGRRNWCSSDSGTGKADEM